MLRKVLILAVVSLQFKILYVLRLQTTPTTTTSVLEESAPPSEYLRSQQDAYARQFLSLIPGHSIMGTGNTSVVPQKPVRIRVLLFQFKERRIRFRDGPSWAISDEMLNICMDGWNRSPWFDVVDATIVPPHGMLLPETDDIVWVVDMRRSLVRLPYMILQQVTTLAQRTKDYQRAHLKDGASLPDLKIVLFDWRDRESAGSVCLKDLVQLVGPGNVRLVLRATTTGRHWDNASNFVHVGHVRNASVEDECYQQPTLPVSYTVRSDYAEAIQQHYDNYLPRHDSNGELSPVDTIRPTDVAHFWSSRNRTENHGNLRNAVTQTVLDIGSNVIGHFVSIGTGIGRTNVQWPYVEALLTTKIVVVAQRDSWEDHYRLFEALVGGALVLTDPMITLPLGLVAGLNLVVYHSLEELRESILYYLAHEDKRLVIARRGYKAAMEYERSFHWMEMLFFGRILTTEP